MSQVLNSIRNVTENRHSGPDIGRNGMAGAGGGEDFAKTLATLSEGLELSMINQALNVGNGADGRDQGGLLGVSGMSGMSLDKLQMNMLMTTLNQMQNVQQATGMAPHAAQQTAQAAAGGKAESETSGNNAAPDMQRTSGAAGLDEALGQLSQRFESGAHGAGAVGYDRMGGTSYGMYQLSSAQGVVGEFIEFLADRNPEWAARLGSAGPADTGSTSGGMPDTWREIARADPEEFGKLQSEFIQGSHYKPALENVLSSFGLDEAAIPPALKEVLFSTAVQHGPTGAASIFEKAMGLLGGLDGSNGLGGLNGLNDLAGLIDQGDGDGGGLQSKLFKGLIEKVYDVRAGQFGGSTTGVQKAVASRFDRERDMALAMLETDGYLT